MRVLITGSGGLLARHLAAYLAREHPTVELYGTTRPGGAPPPGVRSVPCDLLDAVSMRALVAEVRPQRVFHLAAQTSVHVGVGDPARTLTGNLLGQFYLLTALKGSAARVLVAGSAEEYGPVAQHQLPITEDCRLCPVSTYAVSKLGQDLMGYQFFRQGLHVVRVRSFNHTGPGRRARFVESSFAQQVARIEKGLQEPVLAVGNLQAERDLSDARDAARAYWLALEDGHPGLVYNVCSGRPIRIQAVLDCLLALSTVKVEVRVDPARLRPSDIPSLYGSHERLTAHTGWRPEIELTQSLQDLLEEWRDRC